MLTTGHVSVRSGPDCDASDCRERAERVLTHDRQWPIEHVVIGSASYISLSYRRHYRTGFVDCTASSQLWRLQRLKAPCGGVRILNISDPLWSVRLPGDECLSWKRFKPCPHQQQCRMLQIERFFLTKSNVASTL